MVLQTNANHISLTALNPPKMLHENWNKITFLMAYKILCYLLLFIPSASPPTNFLQILSLGSNHRSWYSNCCCCFYPMTVSGSCFARFLLSLRFWFKHCFLLDFLLLLLYMSPFPQIPFLVTQFSLAMCAFVFDISLVHTHNTHVSVKGKGMLGICISVLAT